MWSTARQVAAGDVVIVWMTRDIIQPLLISPGKDFNSKFGAYRHSDLIGIPYGSKVGSRNGKGFIHILRPTPELWTMALPHRTQILYLADIAFITAWLNITRGSHVIEAGTGSGSFSHSIVRSIGPTGHLWSYEFHEARANLAREEFARHGMADVVTLTHRNVCKDGFTVVDLADSVFLDLPAPWDAVEHAKVALRKDRLSRICCFSPCMEQVLRTVSTLNETGFTDITMYETLQRPHEANQISPLSISEISEKIKKSEQKREEKRLKQIAGARARAKTGAAAMADNAAGQKHDVKRRSDAVLDVSSGSKRLKLGGDNNWVASPVQIQSDGPSALPPEKPSPLSGTGCLKTTPSAPPSNSKIVSKSIAEVRGHTSYLTFAYLVPMVAKTERDDNIDAVID